MGVVSSRTATERAELPPLEPLDLDDISVRDNRVLQVLNMWWQPLVVLLLLIGGWILWASHYSHQGLGFMVPYPNHVLHALVDEPLADHQIYPALLHSVEVSLVGLGAAVVIGIVWAVAMVQAKWAERALFPYAVLLQCVPVLAIAPLLGMIFGYNFLARVIVTVMIALFPMVSNTYFGLQSVDKAQRELFKLEHAGRATRLLKLQFPAALPNIFTGMRISAGLSVIGAIVGDQLFQRGSPGLGVTIQSFSASTEGPEMWAAIIVACLYGIAVFLVFGLIMRLVVGRWYDLG